MLLVYDPIFATIFLHSSHTSLAEGRQPVTLDWRSERKGAAGDQAEPSGANAKAFACAAPARPASSAGHPGGFGTRPGGTTTPVRGAR